MTHIITFYKDKLCILHKNMIQFLSPLTGEIKVLDITEKYKYFYHIKAYFIDDNKYCYCTLIDDGKIIDDIEKVSKYEDKTITVIKNNIYIYELKNWVPIENLDWRYLSSNPNAITLLESNPEKNSMGFIIRQSKRNSFIGIQSGKNSMESFIMQSKRDSFIGNQCRKNRLAKVIVEFKCNSFAKGEST